MRILVCGDRNYNNAYDFIEELNKHEITSMISGGARGADSMARSYALSKNIPFDEFPADWNTHGKAAGPIRNSQMLKEGKPDLVIAFLALGSKGTKNMIDQATKAGVKTKVINI